MERAYLELSKQIQVQVGNHCGGHGDGKGILNQPPGYNPWRHRQEFEDNLFNKCRHHRETGSHHMVNADSLKIHTNYCSLNT